MQIALRILLIAVLQITFARHSSDPLGKSLEQVISMRGPDYKKIRDAAGHQGLLYKKVIQNRFSSGMTAVSELVYFDRDTCFKDISILPDSATDCFVDSFNSQFHPAGFHSWLREDSSFISISLRDGFLDITSFTAGYYKNPR